MIEATIQNWLKRFRLSSGDDLSGFVIDCDAYLFHDAFSSVEVKQTDDPLSMVNATIIIKPTVPSLQEITYALQNAWAKISYNEFQATSLHWYEEATVLRFITGVPNSGLGVTGTFMAGGKNYSALVKDFRKNFSSNTRIVPMPGGLPAWVSRLA